MSIDFDYELFTFLTIELCLIGFFLIVQFSSRFNSRFLAGTSLDRRIVERRLIERRGSERRSEYRLYKDRRNEDRRRVDRRKMDQMAS